MGIKISNDFHFYEFYKISLSVILFHHYKMCNITVLSIFQSFLACCLIPEYVLCGHYKLLWFEMFYYMNSKERECSRSPCEYPCSSKCDLYNGLYTVINCIICLSSLITSIALVTMKTVLMLRHENTSY